MTRYAIDGVEIDALDIWTRNQAEMEPLDEDDPWWERNRRERRTGILVELGAYAVVLAIACLVGGIIALWEQSH